MLTQTIKLPVIGYTVKIFYTTDIVATDRLISKRYGLRGQADASWKAFAFKVPGRPIGGIVLRENPALSCVVHECYHVIRAMQRWISAEIEEEWEAYHLDYLVTGIVKFCGKKWSPKNKSRKRE